MFLAQITMNFWTKLILNVFILYKAPIKEAKKLFLILSVKNEVDIFFNCGINFNGDNNSDNNSNNNNDKNNDNNNGNYT